MTAPAPSALPGACDVLIVGAGPTGLLLAALLARRGVDVLVLDRRERPGTHSRAIGLHPPALAALERLGLAEAAVAAGEPIRSGRARSGGRDLGRLHFARAWPDRPFVLSLPQSRTEELLVERLADLAPAALRRGWEVVDLHQRPGAVDVVARSVGARSRATLRARVVVGADGSRSRVRDLVGVTTTAVAYRDTYLMGDVADPDGHTRRREAVIHLEPAGVVESFPLPGGRRRWVAHTGSTVVEATPAALAAIVRERTVERIDPDTATMISEFTVRRRMVRKMVSTRAVLIGDAAHEISPIGGQGITVGWLDALALTPLLSGLPGCDDGGALSDAPAFLRFERRRTKAARRSARMAHLNMALGRPAPKPVDRGRSLLVALLLGSPARYALAWIYSMGWARRQIGTASVRSAP